MEHSLETAEQAMKSGTLVQVHTDGLSYRGLVKEIHSRSGVVTIQTLDDGAVPVNFRRQDSRIQPIH